MPNMESDAATDSVKQGATNMEQDFNADPPSKSSILSRKHGTDWCMAFRTCSIFQYFGDNWLILVRVSTKIWLAVFVLVIMSCQVFKVQYYYIEPSTEHYVLIITQCIHHTEYRYNSIYEYNKHKYFLCHVYTHIYIQYTYVYICYICAYYIYAKIYPLQKPLLGMSFCALLQGWWTSDRASRCLSFPPNQQRKKHPCYTTAGV